MNFATWSIRNPIPSILLFILMGLGGIWGIGQLHVQYLPDIDLPSIRVVLHETGATPAQLEAELSRKVEDSLSTLQGVKHLETSISDGTVIIMVRFNIGKNLSDALIEVKDGVDRIRSNLPQDMDPPNVSAVIAFNDAIMRFAVSSPTLDESAMSWLVDDTIARSMSAIPGVGRFERVGGVDREIRVEVDPTRLAAMGITANEISQALRRGQQQASAGLSLVGMQEQPVRVLALGQQASDIASMQIVLADGRKIALNQVAAVIDTDARRTRMAFLDGKPVVGFNLYRAAGQDEIALDKDVQVALQGLRAAHPHLNVDLVANNIDYTREQYHGSMNMLYEGAILAALVVWWFLRDWRATLVAASALPLSILPVFGLMYLFDFSLNTLTLLALAVVVGILVDDAIVEIENIMRHISKGKTVLEATTEAVNEIALAVIATTFTLVAVFVPSSLMNSVPGMFFREFGWTAAIAILMSLLVARLLTPVMAVRLLASRAAPAETRHAAPEKDGRYLAAVHWCMAHRKSTLLLALLFFVASLALIPLLPAGLLPPSDRGYVDIAVELPPGSNLQETVGVLEEARAEVIASPGVHRVMAVAGTGNRDIATESRRGTLTVELATAGKRPGLSDIESALRRALENIPGARFSIGSGNDDKQLILIVASDDDTAMIAGAKALEREMRGIPGLSNVTSTASLDRPELTIQMNNANAADLGVSAAAVVDAIRVATNGDLDTQVAKLNLDARQLPINVRISDRARADLETLKKLQVQGRGGLVELSQVAHVSMRSGPSLIERYDRRRYVMLKAALGGMPLGTALANVQALPAATHMPKNVSLSASGNAENMHELLSGFAIAMACGVLCVYCVLVVLFRDFVQPLTILSALPLSLGGAFVALLAMHGQLNVPSLIGLIMLMGIVTKNAILLVEYALTGIRDRHLGVRDAMIEACRLRARPVVMTSIAMIAGMLPTALGLGADASFRRPMAIAVIGGLATSTALSLLVVPVVFTVFADAEAWARSRRFAWPVKYFRFMRRQ